MNRVEYLKKRAELMNIAQDLINTGDVEQAKTKRAEIEALDADFEKASIEEANLRVVEDTGMSNSKASISIPKVSGVMVAERPVSYEEVFSKVALRRELTSDEISVFNKFNPENNYTHTVQNTPVVVPTSVADGIYDTMSELHPILADVAPTRIKGVVKYPKRTAINSGDAAYYDETTETDRESNTFDELVLNGWELSKAVSVSWKLQAMAINDFIPFIQRELGDRMGAAKARAFVRGSSSANQPSGIITEIENKAGDPKTNQKVAYKPDKFTYKDLTKAMGCIRSGFISGAKIYANSFTIWNIIANVLDSIGRPLFMADVLSGGVGRVFGIPVMEEDAMKDYEILIGNVARGYRVNIQEDLKLVTESHAKSRNTDFVGYEVHDGGVLDVKAFALLVKEG